MVYCSNFTGAWTSNLSLFQGSLATRCSLKQLVGFKFYRRHAAINRVHPLEHWNPARNGPFPADQKALPSLEALLLAYLLHFTTNHHSRLSPPDTFLRERSSNSLARASQQHHLRERRGGTWLHAWEEGVLKCNSLNGISSHIIIVISAWSCWLGAAPLMKRQIYQHGLDMFPLPCIPNEKNPTKPNQNKEGQLMKNNFPVTQMLFVSVFPPARCKNG